MAKIAKIEAQTEIKSSADRFYGFFKNSMTSFVQMFPQIFQSFEVEGGGQVKDGSVTYWKYDLGSPLTSKVKIQGVDDENKRMSFVVLEGDMMKLYKSFKATFQAMKAAGNGCSIVKWTMEFEIKTNENADPRLYVGLATKVTQGVDAYLTST